MVHWFGEGRDIEFSVVKEFNQSNIAVTMVIRNMPKSLTFFLLYLNLTNLTMAFEIFLMSKKCLIGGFGLRVTKNKFRF